LGGPEQPNLVAFTFPHQYRGPLFTVSERAVICGELVADALVEFQISPSPLAREGKLARHRGAANDRHRQPLFDIDSRYVHGTQKRGAHRAWPLALRAIHPDVGEKCVVAPKQIGEPKLLVVLVAKPIVLGFSARGKFAAERRDAADLAAKLD